RAAPQDAAVGALRARRVRERRGGGPRRGGRGPAGARRGARRRRVRARRGAARPARGPGRPRAAHRTPRRGAVRRATWHSGRVTPPRPPSIALAPPPSVRVRAPGKVNLSLRVGALQDDGYHPLVTSFQAVGLSEDVVAHRGPPGSGVSPSAQGRRADVVPPGGTTLAWRAAGARGERVGVGPDVHLEIHKAVPVAGGMGGGSAHAAAAL